MPLHDLSQFFQLSATINYQLAGTRVGVPNIVALLDPKRDLSDYERGILAEVIDYLRQAYGDSTRRLGPLSIIHPIRCAALLSKAAGKADLLDLLTALLHDKLEDIGTGKQRLKEADQAAEDRFVKLLQQLSSEHEWFLIERITWLTRRESGETYYQYMGSLLSHSEMTPEIVRVKLADRLDNTLDMRVALVDPLDEVDFFEQIFQLLFVRSYSGYKPEHPHPPPSPINGAERLYQLFKNTIMLSLVRQAFPDRDDPVVAKLFDAIAYASMHEAERIVLHLFSYHITAAADQRALVRATLDYCQRGGATRIGDPAGSEQLDGFFIEHFDFADSKVRKAAIARLYDDKSLMASAGLTLVSTFQSFLADAGFRVQGMSVVGCEPVPTSAAR